MKKMLFAFALISVLSCNKKEEMTAIKKDIIGSWELSARGGGFTGITTHYPAGNGSILVFNSNGNYLRKSHDTVLFSGHYTIRKKEDCYSRPNEVALSLDGSSSGIHQYIELRNDSLYFDTPNCYADGNWFTYKRL